MSNHYHMLVVPTDAKQLAAFMNFVNGEIARDLLRLFKWKGKFWARPFDAILVTHEPAAQRARFRYLLSHGVKEGLVEKPWQWIGVHGVDAWLKGEPLRGYWFDRDKETRARRRGKTVERLTYATEEIVELSPLPCWLAEGLSLEEIREEIEAMVEEIVETARLERVLAGRPEVAGTASVLSKPWTYEPEEVESRPRPLFHFRSREVFEVWRAAHREFVSAYRRASEAYRNGQVDVRFPERCFPPSAGFTFDGRVGGESEEGAENGKTEET
jgi:hypothetical protein